MPETERTSPPEIPRTANEATRENASKPQRFDGPAEVTEGPSSGAHAAMAGLSIGSESSLDPAGVSFCRLSPALLAVACEMAETLPIRPRSGRQKLPLTDGFRGRGEGCRRRTGHCVSVAAAASCSTRMFRGGASPRPPHRRSSQSKWTAAEKDGRRDKRKRLPNRFGSTAVKLSLRREIVVALNEADRDRSRQPHE